ncbi:hypothetical protein [Nocardia blacklockiae]|uniref:hypothetical protein n=1 Tax=Nocardia blacklockiae TaxID=480036 RepID=UPI0018955215|nr:hypothetical protein [Nocardia blacklockiae]MBF6176776.1 hypothetical protein [Nocardia blacklockiae]
MTINPFEGAHFALLAALLRTLMPRLEILMSKSSPMDRESADRISAAAERDPGSDTAQSGFDERAEAAATRNEDDYDDKYE